LWKSWNTFSFDLEFSMRHFVLPSILVSTLMMEAIEDLLRAASAT